MRFEWDEQKNQANIEKHGLSFADAAQIFDGPMLVNLDTRRDYGEDRWIGIGLTRGRVVVIAYTEREDDEQAVRVISMRKALKHERERYYRRVFGN
jgi:uncharacterized DUF497 family protein